MLKTKYIMEKTINLQNSSSVRDPYITPFTRSIIVKSSGVICDSYTSNSIMDYNLRSAGSEDLDIDWD